MVEKTKIILNGIVLRLENYSLADASIACHFGVAMLSSVAEVLDYLGLS